MNLKKKQNSFTPIVCPGCGALSSDDDIEHRAYEVSADSLELACKCLVCGCRFSRWYYSDEVQKPKEEE